MANACFRCKEPIDSGLTFCPACREEVSMDFSYTRESRAWVLVAVGVVLQVLVVVGSAAAVVAGATDGTLAENAALGLGVGGMMAFFVSPLVAYGLLKDAEHLRAREDTDWSPSKGWYWTFAGFSMFVLPAPLIAAYHLRRRRAAVGLRVRKYEDRG